MKNLKIIFDFFNIMFVSRIIFYKFKLCFKQISNGKINGKIKIEQRNIALC